MAGALILLIGAAAGVGSSALGIWLWVRRRRSAVSVRNQHDRGGGGGALFDAPPDGPGGTTNPAQEDANLVPAGQQAEQGERSSLVEISDLVRSTSAAARSAVGADLVSCGLDIAGDGDRAPPREAAGPTHWPADVTDADLSVDPGPASAEAPVRPAAGPPEIAPREAEYEAATARPSDKAQPQEYTNLDGALGGEAYGEPGRETDDTAEAAGGAECGAAESAPLVSEGAAAPQVDNQELAPEPVTGSVDAPSDSVAEDTGGEAANAGDPALRRPRPSKLAQHRDRRGQRRVLLRQPAPASELPPPVGAAIRAPAEAKLRLKLHPIRRAAALSAVLARPAGYPDRVTLLLGGGEEVSAYGEDRYDDVDLEWTADLLSGEVRLDSKEGYQWLRSGRRIHIFGEVADEPGVVSVGSAALSSPSTIICRDDDAAAVRAASEACGSPALVSHDRWSGIPDGWTILSGYRPTHAAVSELTSGLTGLDPGVGSEIRLSGGLRIRSASFAQGRPPRIEISPFPSGAIITIDGQPAELGEDGAWSADGWDRPGESSGRCRARTLCHLSHSRGPLVQRRLGDLGCSPRALQRFAACSMGRRASLRCRGVGPGRRICRGSRRDSVSGLPWTSARRSRSARTAGCARGCWSARRTSRIPHLRIGAASESGANCMAQSISA